MGAALRQPTRVAVGLVVALALVAALRELPNALRATEAQTAAYGALSELERELFATRQVGLNPTLILRAEELLPRDAVYYVATGQGMLSGHDAAAPFSAYWLLPRRQTTELTEAEWVLSFGADPAALDAPLELVEDVGAGSRLFRVRR